MLVTLKLATLVRLMAAVAVVAMITLVLLGGSWSSSDIPAPVAPVPTELARP